LKEFQEFGKEGDIPWSLTHSQFANIGGFAIRFNVDRLANHIGDIATQTISPGQEAEIQPKNLLHSPSDEVSSKADYEKATVKTAAAIYRDLH